MCAICVACSMCVVLCQARGVVMTTSVSPPCNGHGISNFAGQSISSWAKGGDNAWFSVVDKSVRELFCRNSV